MVARIAQVKQAMEASEYKALEKEYQQLRTALLALAQSPRNAPLECPGWRVAFAPVPKAGYTVQARTDYHISIVRLPTGGV
jgi:hypothetical protein